METFPIVPAQVRTLWIAIPIVLLVLASLGGLIYSLAGVRLARFEVSSAGLRLRGDFYGRLIPAAELRLADARAIDLRDEPALTPVRRTMGTALSGYRAGWFKLADGQRALLYLTDPSRVVYVPTTRGYAVLLSVADPQALLASLRRVAPAQ